MEQIWPILTALLAANLLTAMFLYGMWRAFKVRHDHEFTIPNALCIAVPLLFLVGGAWIYG